MNTRHVDSPVTSMRFDVKDVTFDPMTMFDRSISHGARGTGDRAGSYRSANFRHGFRPPSPACL